ncbi:MAG: hypothetical protein IT497_09295 [Ottowia sp.]|nr:hypothetical protein [Ottowia sp.]
MRVFPRPVRLTLQSVLLAIAAAIFFFPVHLYAARFGPTHVLSHKGQPLLAEIEIFDVAADQVGWLTLQSASKQSYESASVPFGAVAQEIKVVVGHTPSGQLVARLTTTSSISEDYIDLLLTLGWSTGKMTEALTFLIPHQESNSANEIAPPIIFGMPGAVAPSVLPPNGSSSLTVQGGIADNHKTMPSTLADKGARGEVASQSSIATSTPRTHKVHQGDTLGKIARRIQADMGEGVELDQLLWALYTDNPNAFINENLNLLKAGETLDIPAEREVRDIDARGVHHEIVVQAKAFERYRDNLTAATAPSRSVEGINSSSGNVSASLKDKAVDQPTDQLRLSRSGGAQQEEQKIATEQALREAQQRVAQLEKHVVDLQNLLALTSKDTGDTGNKNQEADAKKAQGGVPFVDVQTPKGPVQHVTEKVSALSRNSVAPLGALLALLLVGSTLLRLRASSKPLFPEQRDLPNASSAQKIFSALFFRRTPKDAAVRKSTSSSEAQAQFTALMRDRKNTDGGAAQVNIKKRSFILRFFDWMIRRRPTNAASSPQLVVPRSAQKVLDELDLDLEPRMTSESAGSSNQVASGDANGSDVQAQASQTRLELAQAYLELGDKSGAAKLLEEVIAHGTAQQRGQAQSLLATLG